jgi:hypothetical protein
VEDMNRTTRNAKLKIETLKSERSQTMKSQRLLMSLVIQVVLLAAMVGLSQAQGPEPQEVDTPQATTGNAFTYQGYLKDGSNPANGEYDFRFILYNALIGGSQVGSAVTKDNVTVTNGLFSVALDFGSVFDGTGLWLEVGVRPGSSTSSYAILDPRQELTPAPYALYAVNIPQHDHFGQSWSGSADTGLLVENTRSAGYPSALQAIATASSGTTRGVTGDSYSTSGIGVLGNAKAATGITYGVYGRADSPQGYGGYFWNSAGATALFAQGAVRSTADTEITVSPFDLRPWSGGVSVAESNWQGYVYFQASTTGPQEVLLPVTLPARVFGVPQKLKSIKVCYQLDNANSYIDQTEAYYYSDSGVITYLFQDDTDLRSTSWTCYIHDDPTPNPIQSAVTVRFGLNYAGTGWPHDIVIGSITLTLTEN